jgi:hypothetical protein
MSGTYAVIPVSPSFVRGDGEPGFTFVISFYNAVGIIYLCGSLPSRETISPTAPEARLSIHSTEVPDTEEHL